MRLVDRVTNVRWNLYYSTERACFTEAIFISRTVIVTGTAGSSVPDPPPYACKVYAFMTGELVKRIVTHALTVAVPGTPARMPPDY